MDIGHEIDHLHNCIEAVNRASKRDDMELEKRIIAIEQTLTAIQDAIFEISKHINWPK